jgi:hypothetical protein
LLQLQAPQQLPGKNDSNSLEISTHWAGPKLSQIFNLSNTHTEKIMKANQKSSKTHNNSLLKLNPHDPERFEFYGYDLFFSNCTTESLHKIGYEIGGNFEVNALSGCVTYKLENSQQVTLENVMIINEKLQDLGKFIASQHGCIFVKNELYMRVREDWNNTVKANSNRKI